VRAPAGTKIAAVFVYLVRAAIASFFRAVRDKQVAGLLSEFRSWSLKRWRFFSMAPRDFSSLEHSLHGCRQKLTQKPEWIWPGRAFHSWQVSCSAMRCAAPWTPTECCLREGGRDASHAPPWWAVGLAGHGGSVLVRPGKFRVWLHRDSLSLFPGNSFLGTIYCPACCQALINELCQIADCRFTSGAELSGLLFKRATPCQRESEEKLYINVNEHPTPTGLA